MSELDKAKKAMENVSNSAHSANEAFNNLSQEARAIVEKYAEHQEKINDPSQVFSYFFDRDGKEKVETYKVKKKVKKYKQDNINKDKTIEYEEDETIDTGKIKLSFPNETIQGESQSMILYMRNNLKSTVELDPYTLDKHLTITEYPKKLKSKEYGRLRLTFSPSFKRFEALTEELGQWGFNYVILAKE